MIKETLLNRIIQKLLENIIRITLNFIYCLKFRKIFPSESILNKQTINSKKCKDVLFSIIVPVHNTDSNILEKTIESVKNQSYQNYELILIDDASVNEKTKGILDQYSRDKRIKIIYNKINKNISVTTNIGIENAQGKYIGLLDHDDYLWPNALFELNKVISENPNIEFIYTDQDKIDMAGKHTHPILKKDFDFNLLRQVNYLNHFTVIKTDLAKKLKLKIGVEGAQDWDLYLRISNIIDNNQIYHLPKILYSWRESKGSTASKEGITSNKKYISAQQKVLDYDYDFRKAKDTSILTRYLGIWTSKDTKKYIKPYEIELYSLKRILNL